MRDRVRGQRRTVRCCGPTPGILGQACLARSWRGQPSEGASPMTTPFTSEVVVAHSQCPRKAYLLLYGDSAGQPHEYVRILERRADANREGYLHTVVQAGATSTRRTLRHGAWEAYCD